ncbi:MAG TPA: PDZ domain-containing protein [Steroidobacteraceae bacterium]
MKRWTGRQRGLGLVRALVPALALALASGVAHSAATTEPQDRAQLEKQLDDARARLDDAARDVAELTQKLHGGDVDMDMPYMHGGPPRGAMLGINIGGDQVRAEGVEVKGVSPAGPAEAAGLRTGDVIVAVDGKALVKSADRSASRQLVEYLRGIQPGTVVKVDYLRGGKRATAAVKTSVAEPPMARLLREHMPMLEGMQLPPEFEHMLGGPARGFRALELVPVTPKLGQYFGTDQGLLVVRAPADAGSKLEEGDVILSIGGRTPENPRHAFRILGSYQPGEKVKVEVLRQRKRTTVEMTVPPQDAAGPMFRPEAPRAPAPPAPPPPPEPRSGAVSS